MAPLWFSRMHGLRTLRETFFQKSWTFELKQTFFAEIFWGIWGIFVQTFSTHVGTLSFLSMFSNIQPFISTKKNYPTPKHLFGSKIWILAPKNLRFGLCVSVVSAQMHWKKKPMQFISAIEYCKVTTLHRRHIIWNNVRQKCGLWILNEMIKRKYAESMKRILGVVWESIQPNLSGLAVLFIRLPQFFPYFQHFLEIIWLKSHKPQLPPYFWRILFHRWCGLVFGPKEKFKIGLRSSGLLFTWHCLLVRIILRGQNWMENWKGLVTGGG